MLNGAWSQSKPKRLRLFRRKAVVSWLHVAKGQCQTVQLNTYMARLNITTAETPHPAPSPASHLHEHRWPHASLMNMTCTRNNPTFTSLIITRCWEISSIGRSLSWIYKGEKKEKKPYIFHSSHFDRMRSRRKRQRGCLNKACRNVRRLQSGSFTDQQMQGCFEACN